MSEEREKAPRWQIQIPEEHYSGFARLLEISDDAFHQLVTALRSTTPTLIRDEFVKQVDDKVAIGREAVADIVAMAISLHIVRTDMHMTTSQFSGVVMEALAKVPNEALGAAAEQRSVAREKIQAILEVGGALNAIAKANDLAGQQERTFLNGRVVTDLRPLFTDDPTEHPGAAIIMHTLKITYVKEYERRDFYVTLDSTGIGMLRDILERAEEKANTITAKFAPSVHILEGNA